MKSTLKRMAAFIMAFALFWSASPVIALAQEFVLFEVTSNPLPTSPVFTPDENTFEPVSASSSSGHGTFKYTFIYEGYLYFVGTIQQSQTVIGFSVDNAEVENFASDFKKYSSGQMLSIGTILVDQSAGGGEVWWVARYPVGVINKDGSYSYYLDTGAPGQSVGGTALGAIMITKAAVPGLFTHVGEQITYTITVRNRSSINDPTLYNVQLSDYSNAGSTGTNHFWNLGDIPTTPPQNQVIKTYTHIITTEDVTRGYIENTATATANGLAPVSATFRINYYSPTSNVLGYKNWEGGPTADHTAVELVLQRRIEGGTAATVGGATYTVSGMAPNFTYTWTDMPDTDENGAPYIYSVLEPTVPDNYTSSVSGLTVTNSYKIPTDGEAEATKTWENGPTADHTAVTLKLYREAPSTPKELVPGTPTLNITGTAPTFTYKWTGLEKTNAAGEPYTFTVEEDGVVDGKITVNGNVYAVTQDGNAITNTYVIPEDGEAEATKTWVNSLTPHPTIWFKLYRQIEGGAVEEVPVAQAPIRELPNGTTTAKWTGLEETDINGNAYTFSVKEVDADGNDDVPIGYTKVENGLTVTNSSKTATLTVKKEVDGPMLDDTLKFPITVTINGVDTEIELSKNESKDFPNLPYGSEFKVLETAPAGYTPTYTNQTGKVEGAAVTATVTNTSKTATLTVEKKVVDATVEKEFSIDVTINGTKQTIVLKDGESTSFPDLPYGSQYSIEEVPVPAGYSATYSNKTGEMEGEAKTEMVINTYKTDPVEVVITGTKTLSGRTGDFSDEFKFTLNGADEQTLTFVANGTQNFSFPALTYNLSDLEGKHEKTFTYKVAEKPCGIPGMVDDLLLERTVVVTVTDNGDGTLKAALNPEVVAFTNTYKTTSANIAIQAQKVLKGRGWLASDSFTFTLKGEIDGNIVNQALVIKDGKVQNFDALTFAKPGSYTFTITETKGSLGDITYDTTPKTVKVTVVDNMDGTLKATVEPGVTIITNTYVGETEEPMPTPKPLSPASRMTNNLAECFE